VRKTLYTYNIVTTGEDLEKKLIQSCPTNYIWCITQFVLQGSPKVRILWTFTNKSVIVLHEI